MLASIRIGVPAWARASVCAQAMPAMIAPATIPPATAARTGLGESREPFEKNPKKKDMKSGSEERFFLRREPAPLL
jgi:hypothetical protein